MKSVCTITGTAAVALAVLSGAAAAQDIRRIPFQVTDQVLTDAIRIEIAPGDYYRCGEIMVRAFNLPGPDAGFGPMLPGVPAGFGPRCAINESPAVGAMTEAFAN